MSTFRALLLRRELEKMSAAQLDAIKGAAWMLDAFIARPDLAKAELTREEVIASINSILNGEDVAEETEVEVEGDLQPAPCDLCGELVCPHHVECQYGMPCQASGRYKIGHRRLCRAHADVVRRSMGAG